MQTSLSASHAPAESLPRASNSWRAAPEKKTSQGNDHASKRAKRLGWLSIGLGLTQLAAPDTLSRVIGLRPDKRTRSTMLALGLRECSAGVGLLVQNRPKAWLWARVAGDVMDLTLLGRALVGGRRHRRDSLMLATGATAGVLALDYLTARDLSPRRASARAMKRAKQTLKMTQSISVNRAQGEVEAQWRRYEEEQRTGIDVAFERAVGGKGTEVCAKHARLKGPAVLQALRHFKQIVETGEVLHSDASIHRAPHPAQPSNASRKKAKS